MPGKYTVDTSRQASIGVCPWNHIIAQSYGNTWAWKTHYVQWAAISMALEWSRCIALRFDQIPAHCTEPTQNPGSVTIRKHDFVSFSQSCKIFFITREPLRAHRENDEMKWIAKQLVYQLQETRATKALGRLDWRLKVPSEALGNERLTVLPKDKKKWRWPDLNPRPSCRQPNLSYWKWRKTYMYFQNFYNTIQWTIMKCGSIQSKVYKPLIQCKRIIYNIIWYNTI